MDSIGVSYHPYGNTYAAKASTGFVQPYRSFSIVATGEGITVNLSGYFLEDGISVSGTVSIFLENSITAGISWSGSFQEPLSLPFLMADFTSDKIRGMKPLPVQFTDLSLGNIKNWKWDFGDGNSATTQNPNHTYETAGEFTVSLMVSDTVKTDTLIRYGLISVSQPTGVENYSDLMPQQFELGQNYPNPFNQSTAIQFSVPIRNRISITIYNMVGEVIEVLLDKEMQPGKHRILWDNSNLAAGIYIYKMVAGSFADYKMCILLK